MKTRRHFLKASALAFPSLIPGSALGKNGSVAPSNRIALGFIGCGSRMGALTRAFSSLFDVQAVAVCDVDRGHREATAKRLQLDAEGMHIDFRELVARPDVDAVVIATPDHWHVPIAIHAAQAGKDVYCEKPLSNTITEGRALVDVASRYGTIFQHGTQLLSEVGTRRACELVRNGRIGALKEIRIGSPSGRATGPQPAMPVPATLDYDMWLGPAPVEPYTAARVSRHEGLPGWYFISDYSKAGWIAGYGVHDLDIAQWGMGLEHSGPISVEGRGVYPQDGLFDTVLTFRIEYEYANGVRLILTDTAHNRHGVTFVGESGSVFTRGGLEATPQSLLKESIRPGETHLYRSPGHARNFIDSVKSRAPTITPPEVAHRATTTALLGGIACQLQRKLRWSPETERFIDDSEADRLLSCAMRSTWQ